MISIVVIEFNSVEEIRRCVKAVGDYCKDVDYELIVSSNSCYPKERQEELKNELPAVKWSFNKRNGGFAYGMNRGLRLAKGDYLVIMNPDVEIKGSLKVLTDFLDAHQNIGAIAPQIIGHDGSIQDSCRRFVTPWRFFSRQLRRGVVHKKSILTLGFDYSRVQTVECLIGAFVMIKREVYVNVGGLDEKYFMYAEDIDWCTRIWQAGYGVVYYPKLQIMYEGSRSARKNTKYAKIFLKSHVGYWNKFGWSGMNYPKTKHIYFED